MIKEVKLKQASELFSLDKEFKYQIPRYQREYVWQKWNWESLFDDILENQNGHFLGSIICLNIEPDDLKDPTFELVDGQQRMTTLSLLYLSIYQFLQENKPEELSEDELLFLITLRNRITINKGKKIRLTPSITNNNLDDYSYLFSQVVTSIGAVQKPGYFGIRRLPKAYNYFYGRLSEIDEEGNPLFNYSSVKDFLKKVNDARIVKIDVKDYDSAFTLFETLNNRGVPLSAIDLIKNKLLGRLQAIDPARSIDDDFTRWKGIIDNLLNNEKVQERFLRQFYNAFKVEEGINLKNANKAIRSNIIKIYESLIEKDVYIIFDRLEEAAISYNNFINYKNKDYSEPLKRALANLENVNGVDSYMLLMFIDKRFNPGESELEKLSDFLCKYAIRRNVTDTPPTRDITNRFIDIIEKLNGFAEYSFEEVRKTILELGKPASDLIFKEKLNGDLYDENVGATRYILSSIESAMSSTDEIYVDFYERNKKLFKWTVEHIFPQGENIPDVWVEMIANGDKKEAAEIQSRCVHKLGNLTLTGYNSSLSNSSLKIKQNKEKDGKNVGFKNGLWLNNQLKDTSEWTMEKIEKRTELLVKKALEIFKL